MDVRQLNCVMMFEKLLQISSEEGERLSKWKRGHGIVAKFIYLADIFINLLDNTLVV
jgi:hypothetical protein